MPPDLKLILGERDGTQTEIMVFHQVMINASPVFDAMLSPAKYAEGTSLSRDKFLELPLPDDDPHAMRLLCDILHLQSHKVISTAITPDLLDSIATLVDKYDFARAIHPWPQIWLQLTHIQDQVTQSDRVSDQHLLKWTHICCHLGYSTYFEKITSELVARVCLDDFDDYLFDDSFAKLPAQIQDLIRTKRQRCVDRIRRLCIDLVTGLEESPFCSVTKSSQPTAKQEAFNCASILLGNAILALRDSFGPKWRSPNAWSGSVNEIYQKMKTISSRLDGPFQLKENKNQDYHYSSYSKTDRHLPCTKSADFLAPLEDLFKDAIKGLTLEQVGNPFYHKLSEDGRS